MKIATGTVVGGKVEVPEEFMAEGSTVMVLATDDEEPIRLSADQERELSEAMDEIRRGEFVDGHDLLAELRALARH
jgi:hypothetical protein